MSRLNPRAKLLALLVLNALVMRAAIAFWFVRFFEGFGLALYVYRTTWIGQMKVVLRAVHLPRLFVDSPRRVPCDSDGNVRKGT